MNESMNNSGRKRFGPVPVKEGEVYDVTIEGIGEKGDGIAKVRGFVIVVPNTQQGQNVKVKVTAVRGKVSFGEVIGEADSIPKANEEEQAETLQEETGETNESDETKDSDETEESDELSEPEESDEMDEESFSDSESEDEEKM